MTDTKTSYMAAGRAFEMPRLATDLLNTEPFRLFTGAHATLSDYSGQVDRIVADLHLSPVGREAKLAPLHEHAWGALVGAWIGLRDHIVATDRREAALLAVPELHREAAAVAIEDREVRDWWRAQPVATRAEILRALGEDAEQAAKYARLQLALLRSPIPLPDPEVAHVRTLWNRARRLDNPVEALAIDRERNAIEWAERGLGHLTGILRSVSRWTVEQIAGFVAADERREAAAGRVGVTSETLAAAKLRLRAHARAA